MSFFFFPKANHFHVSDIPRTTSPELKAETYPPRSRQFPAWTLNELIHHYGPQIHGIVDNVSLSESAINKLLMPSIETFIRMVHLLPASETQHHSGLGGLLVHSLESARIAIRLGGLTLFDQEASGQNRFSSSNRWEVAAVALLLIHDLGKVLDVRVVDTNGDLWDPNTATLYDWLKACNTKIYFVDWKSDRIHKSHEYRALRFAYRHILTDDLFSYISADGNGRILDAIDDALILKEGVLADILKEADSQSVANDLALRKHFPSEGTYLSSPVVTPLVAAIQENIQAGLWSINCEDASVFVTAEGTFLRLSTQIGKEIRETAVRHGNQSVPANTDAQFQILAESCLLETTDTGDVAIFSLTLFGKEFHCVRFLRPERIFSKGLPGEIPITPVREAKENFSPTQKPNENLEIPLELSSPKATDYTALLKQTLSPSSPAGEESPSETSGEDVSNPITVEEMTEVLDVPLAKEAAKHFARRLFVDAANQLRRGHGILIAGREEEEHLLMCSSLPIEIIAANHGLSSATLDALFQTLPLSNHLTFDANKHLLTLAL